MLSPEEVTYLSDQRLARLATVVPVITWSWGVVTSHDHFAGGDFTPRRTVWDAPS